MLLSVSCVLFVMNFVCSTRSHKNTCVATKHAWYTHRDEAEIFSQLVGRVLTGKDCLAPRYTPSLRGQYRLRSGTSWPTKVQGGWGCLGRKGGFFVGKNTRAVKSLQGRKKDAGGKRFYCTLLLQKGNFQATRSLNCRSRLNQDRNQIY